MCNLMEFNSDRCSSNCVPGIKFIHCCRPRDSPPHLSTCAQPAITTDLPLYSMLKPKISKVGGGDQGGQGADVGLHPHHLSSHQILRHAHTHPPHPTPPHLPLERQFLCKTIQPKQETRDLPSSSALSTTPHKLQSSTLVMSRPSRKERHAARESRRTKYTPSNSGYIESSYQLQNAFATLLDAIRESAENKDGLDPNEPTKLPDGTTVMDFVVKQTDALRADISYGSRDLLHKLYAPEMKAVDHYLATSQTDGRDKTHRRVMEQAKREAAGTIDMKLEGLLALAKVFAASPALPVPATIKLLQKNVPNDMRLVIFCAHRNKRLQMAWADLLKLGFMPMWWKLIIEPESNKFKKVPVEMMTKMIEVRQVLDRQYPTWADFAFEPFPMEATDQILETAAKAQPSPAPPAKTKEAEPRQTPGKKKEPRKSRRSKRSGRQA